MLTARGPKILDFGLAKAVKSATQTEYAAESASGPLTEAGTTVGTVAYMSPEQLRGEELDGRSDLFSLGLVLYEMITGRPAFSGATPAVVSAAILNDAPPPPRTFRPELPDAPRRHDLEDPRERSSAALSIGVGAASGLQAVRPRVRAELGAAAGAQQQRAPRALLPPPPSAAPSSDAQLVAALVKRHRRGVSLAALVLVAAVVGISLSLLRGTPDGAVEARTPATAAAAPFSLQNASVTRSDEHRHGQSACALAGWPLRRVRRDRRRRAQPVDSARMRRRATCRSWHRGPVFGSPRPPSRPTATSSIT